ncbi:MAG: Mur ligase family protein, partial [Planctomycetota bacterium]
MKPTKPENLNALVRGLGISCRRGSLDLTITEITDDSRAVTAGCLFVARPGGDERWRDYAARAAERGAGAVLAADAVAVPDGVTLLLAERVDQALAGAIAARFFGEPAKQLKLIGVTGTNGKTTVAHLVAHLLEAAGRRPAVFGIPNTAG